MCPADPLMSFRHRHAGEPVTRRRAVTAGWQTASPHPAPACSSLRTERACCCPPRRAEPPLGSAVTGRAGCGAYRWPQAGGTAHPPSDSRTSGHGLTASLGATRMQPTGPDHDVATRGCASANEPVRQRTGPPGNGATGGLSAVSPPANREHTPGRPGPTPATWDRGCLPVLPAPLRLREVVFRGSAGWRPGWTAEHRRPP